MINIDGALQQKIIPIFVDALCSETSGGDILRRSSCYVCNHCSLTVCSSCFDALLEKKEFRAVVCPQTRDNSIFPAPADDVPSGSIREEREAMTSCAEFVGKCYICDRGKLFFEATAVFPWSCEADLPKWRKSTSQVTVAYHEIACQKFRMIKSARIQREEAVAVPLHGRCFALPRAGADADNAGAAHFFDNNVMDEDAIVVEGSSVGYSVSNQRNAQRCVWCAVSSVSARPDRITAKNNRPLDPPENDSERQQVAAGKNDGEPAPLVSRRRCGANPWRSANKLSEVSFKGRTIVPFVEWICPPSLENIPDRNFALEVPRGAYDLLDLHELWLFTVDDIMTIHGAELSSSAQPILRVRVAHTLVGKSLDCLMDAGEVPVSFLKCKPMVLTAKENLSERETARPRPCWNYASPELFHCVDALLHGRNVLVYGVGNKSAFLQFVRDSHKLVGPGGAFSQVKEIHCNHRIGATASSGSSHQQQHFSRQVKAIAAWIEKAAASRRNAAGQQLLDGRRDSTPTPFKRPRSPPAELLTPAAVYRSFSRAPSDTPFTGVDAFCMNSSAKLCQRRVTFHPLQMFSHLASHRAKRIDSAVLAALNEPDGHSSRQTRGLVVVHGIDFLDAVQLGQLTLALKSGSTSIRISILASVDDPEWLTSASPQALEFFRFNLVEHCDLRTAFLPRNSTILDDVAAAEAELGLGYGTKSGGHARGPGGLSLPLKDTVYRTLLSVPDGFLPLFKALAELQEGQQEGEAWMPMHFVADALDKQGMTIVSPARLKALLHELTSNRLAMYDSARHAVHIPQTRLVLTVLQDVVREKAARATQGK